jgi:hypothetical protein
MMINREVCSNCGSSETEFVQMATGREESVETTTEKVGNGLLELRYCLECEASIENILTLEKQKTIDNGADSSNH